MKTTTPLILLFIIACFTQSCSKDHQITNETQLHTIKTTFTNIVWYRAYEINDVTKKMIVMRDSANGVVITSSFEYDADGKMSKVNFGQGGVVTHYLEFEYNPDGTIHKRQVRSETINVGDDYNIYSYDASGRIIIDSQFSKGNTSTYQLFAVSDFHYTGANVTEAEYYELANGNLQLNRRRKYEYDNKLNPYKNLENHYYYNEFGSAIYDACIMGENNFINAYTAIGNDPFQLTETNSYQYNSSNYPIKLNPELEQSPANLEKEEYFYR
ncbi:MAG: hypothetical protein ABI480_09805 [Chitinophagaceae bacterium]